MGIAALELSQLTNAKMYFKKLVDEGQFEDDANWYLALLSLKENNPTQAKKWLQKILHDDFVATPARKQKAAALLEKL